MDRPPGARDRSIGTSALRRWSDDLAAWRIPDEILARAPEPPWAHPVAVFARRADARLERTIGACHRRSIEALPEAGSVLDVGSGAGAVSLPLLARASTLVAVDADPAMLDELERRVPKDRTLVRVVGRWPDVAPSVQVTDVAVCAHVLYNVPDLEPFVRALHDHARRRVVIEITHAHPTSRLGPLWSRFHGLRRPDRPTWEDALAAIRSLGIDARAELDTAPPDPPAASFDEVVAMTRRRLCLPAERDGEVGAALREMGYDPAEPMTWTSERQLCTIWWDR